MKRLILPALGLLVTALLLIGSNATVTPLRNILLVGAYIALAGWLARELTGGAR